jgi:hypothetical protein
MTAKEILKRDRPLFDLDAKTLATMILQAEFMANSIQETHDPESMSAKIIILTSHNIISDVQHEIAQRN